MVVFDSWVVLASLRAVLEFIVSNKCNESQEIPGG